MEIHNLLFIQLLEGVYFLYLLLATLKQSSKYNLCYSKQ